MLFTDEEKEVMKNARQSNMRNPDVGRQPFLRILEDFFEGMSMKRNTVLDLGPGQWDFADLIKEKPRTNIFGVDDDPAVIALGKLRGYECCEHDMKEPLPYVFGGVFDGIFCKYSVNAFWFPERRAHYEWIDRLMEMLAPGGWFWFAPWNGGDSTSSIATRVQWDRFHYHGCVCVELSEEESIKYGVHGVTHNRPLFTKNLRWKCL
jgi:hypothetical protein